MLGGLKVTLPHLSLSRNNSPSRSTPSTAAADGPKSATPELPSPDLPMNPPSIEHTKAKKASSSLGPLGAVLRRSSSFRANGSLTPSTAINPVPVSAGIAASAPALRSSSDNSIGLTPLQKSLGGNGHSGRRGDSSSSKSRRRAVSGDRHEHGRSLHKETSRSKTLPNVYIGPASAGGLAISHSTSHPPLGRKAGKHSPTLHGSQTPLGTSSAAAFTNAAAGTASSTTPMSSAAIAPALHQLEESYVGKVGLKLGEAVNKVFILGSATAPGGASEVVLNGRPAPRVTVAKQCGELVVQELHAAIHDAYLLRTLLRSSVLKSLSLFLTRLTTLLLPPDLMPPPPLTTKEVETLSPSLRFNLTIVRCAYELRRSLLAAGQLPAMPAFVRETLRPWTDKLAEVMTRVMNPIITSVRIVVSGICAKARIPSDESNIVNGHSSSTMSILGGEHDAAAMKSTAAKGATSQLRSLSMGRAAPTPASSATSAKHGHGHGHGGDTHDLALGPLWLRELTGVLEATAKLVARLECGGDADKWLVSVGTHAVWKGMLALASRKIAVAAPSSSDGAAKSLLTTSAEAKHPGAHIVPTKGLFKSTSKKASAGPGDSPPFGTDGSLTPQTASTAVPTNGASIGSHLICLTSAIDVAFIRLLCELELLETRLIAFTKHLSTPSSMPILPPLMSGSCSHELACGLCKTDRQFDAESSDDEDEGVPAGSTEAALAHSAMREAMQALSAMIVVVRASKHSDVLLDAIREDGVEDDPRKKHESLAKSGAEDRNDEPMTPLTPMDLMRSHEPLILPATPANISPEAVIVEDKSSSKPLVCPTLRHALATLPDLILLHLLASRCRRFSLPHERWGLADWRAYEKELRGFQAGEEWTAEIAWEMVNEVAARENELALETKEGTPASTELAALELVREAARIKVGVEVGGA
ncbi:BQ2448_6429 [Microbotryum intermedium]|uniref:BQ2448_6429 protein n=1 Tax=Microbotryum intermedium TaxID=269621 RepID=A0A238FMI2_9BASI|nr:BQ2448_6429 [Microbotryum intermedium]